MAVELFDSARKYQNEKVLLIRCRGDTFTGLIPLLVVHAKSPRWFS